MARAILGAVALAAGIALSPVAHAQPMPLPPLGPLQASTPWLGVTMDGGGDIGVKIEHVVRGSPADRGGIRAGDRIVVIDGVKITAPAQVTRAVSLRKVGDTASIDLDRRGTPVSASIVLAARPSGDEILKMDLVGAPAPAWQNVTPLAGAPASMASLKGRVVLVDFWASWCGPCRMLAPRLSALKDKLGAQGLSVVGITTDEAEKAAVFAEKHQMRYGIVVDKDGDTSRTYGITGLPTMLLVDKKGVVRDVFVGFDPSGEAKLEAQVRQLLAENAGAPVAPVVPAPSAPRPPAR
ncbi:MAG: redoxin domain-containing protein [Labilithrix sp.]|nr:redoxin domain-containing protein [Labilithrix sp.]